MLAKPTTAGSILYGSAIVLFLILFASSVSKAQTMPFKDGESLDYSITYHLWGAWVGAGEVNFKVEEVEYRQQDCFRFTGFGKTYPRYDWFFKVRDTYTSYATQEDLVPLRFSRDVLEGNFYYQEENIYNYNDSVVYSFLKVKEKDMKYDTFNVLPNSKDVLSLIYEARRINFDEYRIGDRIPIRMAIDRKVYELYIRYLGTEVYDHKEFGEIDCFVFSPLLVEGTIFREGEGMKVWVSRDHNLIPIYVESQIRVGSIRSELIRYEGLKSPLGEY